MNEVASESREAPNGAIHEIALTSPSRRVFLEQSVRERIGGALWSIVRNTLFRFSPRFANGWRTMLLRLFKASVGHEVAIAPSVRIDFPWNLRIGSGVTIEHKVILNAMGVISIGDASRISQYAHLCAGTHDHEHRAMRIVRCPIGIGRDVWIAADAFVGPDVTIGDGSLLAARSSAFKSLPPGHVCIGEPAQPVKLRGGGAT